MAGKAPHASMTSATRCGLTRSVKQSTTGDAATIRSTASAASCVMEISPRAFVAQTRPEHLLECWSKLNEDTEPSSEAKIKTDIARVEGAAGSNELFFLPINAPAPRAPYYKEYSVGEEPTAI